MITIPPRHYCIVENPVQKDDEGEVVVETSGQAKLRHADQVSFHSVHCSNTLHLLALMVLGIFRTLLGSPFVA